MIGLVFAAHQVSSAAAQEGPLQLTGPPHLDLEDGATAEFRARAPAGQTLRFYASIGEVQVESSGAEYRIRYEPPSVRHPDVAYIVAVTDDWSVLDWAALALRGLPTIQVRFEARSEVRIRIGEEEFGPIRTGRDGVAAMKVTVPPGVHEAHAFGRDRLGNTREQVLPLSPEPFARTFAVCPPTGNRVWVFTTDARGQPTSETTPEVSVSAGAVGPARSPVRGAFVIPVQMEVPTGDAEVRVAADLGESRSSECVLPTVAPQSIAISLGQLSVVEGRDGRVDVRVHLTYPPNVLPRGASPQVETSFGSVNGLTMESPVEFATTWTLPGTFGDRTEAQLTAAAGELEADATIHLEYPAPGWELGLQAGLIANFGKILGPVALVSAGRRIEVGQAQRFVVGIATGYWGSWHSAPEANSGDEVRLRLAAVPMLANVRYELQVGRVDVFARVVGGGAFSFSSLDSDASGQTKLSETTWLVGGTAGAGLSAGPGLLTIEVGYIYAPLRGMVSGNLAGLITSLGYAVAL